MRDDSKNRNPDTDSHDAETAAHFSRPRSGPGSGAPGSGSKASDAFFAPRAPAEPEPENIGPYRIVRRIGHGGMGLVYLAMREDDKFHRRVAIKVIKKGMDSDEITRRFEQERQVLSALNHANIARLIDGGAMTDGRPYFVMEYIEGMPIDEYCDKNRLHIEERLQLFRTLCQAVHHAHQNLIVHRDIKPSNVVITQDGSVKLLDFGIAKLLNPEMSSFSNEPTATALRLMTPEYASPEQVRGDPLSTASDIYSLGVLLYELVTGRRPYHFKTRLQSEIERIICEEDPERPSTAISREPVTSEKVIAVDSGVSTSSGTLEAIAKLREAKPDGLRKKLSGDIDNMIMLAMRKEPRRRYASAEQFGEDIQRHLTGMPVIARPATFSYRFSKFITRNKWGVAAAALIAVSLVLGITGTTWKAIEASANATEARTAQGEAEKQEQVAVNEKNAAEAAKKQSEDVRRLTNTSLQTLNDAILKLSGANEARDLVIKTSFDYLKEFKTLVGESYPLKKELASWYLRLGDMQGGIRTSNEGNTKEALASYQTGVEMLDQLQKEDPKNIEVTRMLCTGLFRVGDMHKKMNSNDLALAEYEKARGVIEPIVNAAPGELENKRLLAVSVFNIAEIARIEKKTDLAKQTYQRSQTLREELMNAQPGNIRAITDVTNVQVRIAEMLKEEGKYDEAIVKYHELRLTRQKLVETEPINSRHKRKLAWADYYIGQVRLLQQDYPAAVKAFENGRAIMKTLFDAEPEGGESTTDLTNMLTALGDAYSRQHAAVQKDNIALATSSRDAAIKYFSESYALLSPYVARDASNGPAQEWLVILLISWADVEERNGEPTKAYEHLARAKEICKELMGKRANANVLAKSIDDAILRVEVPQ